MEELQKHLREAHSKGTDDLYDCVKCEFKAYSQVINLLIIQFDLQSSANHRALGWVKPLPGYTVQGFRVKQGLSWVLSAVQLIPYFAQVGSKILYIAKVAG